MYTLKNILCILSFFCICSFMNAKTDTTQIINNIKKINDLFETKIDLCKPLILKSIEESKSIKFNKGTARLYLLLSQFYILKGLPDSAIAIAPKLEEAAKHCNDKSLNVNILLKIALLYSDIGNFKNAINKAIEAQKLAEDIKNYKLLAKVNHDLGFIYSNKSLYKSALSYYKKGLEYALIAKDTFSIANLNARIGGIYNNTYIPDSGLYYNKIALKFFESIHMKRGIGVSYNNIAGSYEGMKNYQKAIDYYTKAIPIREELGDDYAITIINYNLGLCYLHLKMYPLAEQFLTSSLKKNKAEKDYPQILETLKQLCILYSESNKLNLYKESATEYMNLKDSITSADNIKAISELQEQYQSEKKEKNIILLKKENEKQEEISQSERNNKFVILISSIVVLILMSIFSFVLHKRYKISQKQKGIIQQQKNLVDEKNKLVEDQKNIVEEKQKEILDSISYAKRLQEAILPPIKYVKEHLPEFFILYKPKDIVAGDFYWMEVVSLENGKLSGEKKNNIKSKQKTSELQPPNSQLILFAAADCTGHGVPGAMVSVVCSNALNRSVKEFGITDPGKILDKARELVVETFVRKDSSYGEKSESEVKDGMDISLFCLNKSANILEWAGANNPLWIVRNKELIEYKANKQPVGKIDNPTPFLTHTIPLQLNDCIYIFTDGYADQFGGEKGKKFKYSQLKEILLSNNSLPMPEQLTLLDKHLNDWKGNLEQVDDILIIGIKI